MPPLRTLLLRILLVAATLAPRLAANTPTADTELLLQWTPAIAEAIQTSTASPCLASRNLAIIYTAGFDAINAVDPAYEDYLDNVAAPEGIDATAAGVAAIAYSAEVFFPSQRAAFARLRTQQFDQLRVTRSEARLSASIDFGQEVARRLITERADDGSTSGQTYYPKEEIGKWKRTPPRHRPPELSYWANTRPFVLESASQFRLPPPPALDSPAYAQALEEVRSLGAKESANRTADQTEIAQFWSCFSYTSTPAGHWYEIATKLAREERLSLLESARLLALINLAMADAGIACWDTKYHYEFWRPVHAVRAASNDGNPATIPDENWISLLEAPPHPEYASGHGAFSGAGAKVMELFFDAEDGYPFTTTSSALPGVVRRYASFAECADEICLSRVYGGIHFRFSNDLGRQLGEQIAEHVFANALRPLPR